MSEPTFALYFFDGKNRTDKHPSSSVYLSLSCVAQLQIKMHLHFLNLIIASRNSFYEWNILINIVFDLRFSTERTIIKHIFIITLSQGFFKKKNAAQGTSHYCPLPLNHNPSRNQAFETLYSAG